jgi:hypothetical protein
MLKQWVGKLKDKIVDKSGERIDLLKLYNCTTFDVMSDLTFGEGKAVYPHIHKRSIDSVRQTCTCLRMENTATGYRRLEADSAGVNDPDVLQVATIFRSIKFAAIMRAIKKTSVVVDWMISTYVVQNPKIMTAMAGMLSGVVHPPCRC